MTGACYNVALTCGYAVFGYDTGLDECLNPDSVYATQELCVVHKISDVFYQSLLCPEHSTYDFTGGEVATNRTMSISSALKYVNSHCKCDAGYSIWNGSCVETCPVDATENKYRNAQGICSVCPTGKTAAGGAANSKEHNKCDDS